MISVNNLSKTYFKGKQNEIKVINNTTLELPDHGLVSFLGQSGSGKTTLLNTIGGLDKANSGSIKYDDVVIKKYNMGKVDSFRRNNIGYVFQNYLLMEDMTIYDNLRLALDIIDITDETEVKKRIEYALRAVGLYKYRKKLASALSGGQQQRVSIARALVKNCKIIIADEPTGNLDSENSIEIMNILKKISKESLVLLVTHSPELASFYSDRIIEIKDGVVIEDKENSSTGELNRENSKVIHLLDYDKNEVSSDKVELEVYTNDKSQNHKIRIIVRDNMVFVDSESPLQIVSSSIKIENTHEEKIDLSKSDDFSYDTSFFEDKKTTKKLSRFFKKLKASFKLSLYVGRKKKFFNSVFVILGVLMGTLMVAKSSFNRTTKTDYNFDAYNIYRGDLSNYDIHFLETSERNRAIDAGIITDICLEESTTLNFTINSVIETFLYVNYYELSIDRLPNDKLLKGEMPKTTNEVILGKKLADKIIDECQGISSYEAIMADCTNFKVVGISSCNTLAVYIKDYIYDNSLLDYDDLATNNFYRFGYIPSLDSDEYTYKLGESPLNSLEIAMSFSLASKLGYDIGSEIESPIGTCKLVGLYIDSDVELPSCVTNDTNLLKYGHALNEKKIVLIKENDDSIKPSILPYNRVKYTLLEGREIVNDNEILIPYCSGYKVGDVINGLEVVGIFAADKENVYFNCSSPYKYCNLIKVNVNCKGLVTYSRFLKNQANEYNNSSFLYLVDDIDQAREYFSESKFQIMEHGEYNYIKYSSDNGSIYKILETVLWIVIIVYTFFSERAKIISDVYSIGVMRSLGISRSRLFAKQIRDNFAKTTLTTFVGYLVVMVGYIGYAMIVNNAIGRTEIKLNWLYILGGGILVYVIEMVISCIPLLFLLRKTPSEINSKYDI